MTDQHDGSDPRGEKGYSEPSRGLFEPPDEVAEQSLKGDQVLQETTKAKAFELEEQEQKKGFRTVMMFGLPIAAGLWLVFIAVATVCEMIKGLHVGIPLGLTGAGLLTLLGLQIAWANSQPNTAETHPASIVLKSGMKLLVE